MKVGIIGFSEEKYMPYLIPYLKILGNLDIEHDLITWNRKESKKLEERDNIKEISIKIGDNLCSKIIPFLKWKRQIKKIISLYNYDEIIILTTVPAVLLFPLLKKKYKKKFIFDIRDYTFEKYFWYRYIVNNIVNLSKITIISSVGFLNFIEKKNNIYIMHNIPNIDQKPVCLRSEEYPIRISYLGIVDYYDANKKLINALSNNPKYMLLYIGKFYEKKNVKKYCEYKKITNVTFGGEYDERDKMNLYDNCNFINAYYGVTDVSKYLLPNKLYDCLLYKIPLIVANGTFLSSLVRDNNLGIVIDETDDISLKLSDEISKFDYNKFDTSADKVLKDIIIEQKVTFNAIEQFLLKIKEEV